LVPWNWLAESDVRRTGEAGLRPFCTTAVTDSAGVSRSRGLPGIVETALVKVRNVESGGWQRGWAV